jgi:hypothetical protein
LIQNKGRSQGAAPLIDEKLHSNAHLYSKELKAIEEMSRRNLDAKPLSDAFFWIKYRSHHFFQSKYVQASLAMILVMVSISAYENLNIDDSKFQELVVDPWFGPGSAIGLTWQKTKQLWPSEPVHPVSIEPLQASLPVQNSGNVSQEVVAAKDQASEVSPKNSPQAPIANLSGSQPIFNAKGSPVLLSPEQDNWCRSEEEQTIWTSVSNAKPATYIYLVANAGASLCVKDAKNRIFWLEFQVNQPQTLSGEAPWKLKSRDWSAFQLFFQGRRIPLPNNDVHQMLLKEATPEAIQAFAASQSAVASPLKP